MDDPIIEYPEYVNVVELETAAFKCAKDADAWARSHGIVGLMSNIDTGGKGEMVEIVVLYGCVSFGGIAYRAKTTLKDLKYPGQPTKAYSYEISSIEVLAGNCRVVTRPNTIASMSVNILLKDVLNVNGEFLLTPTASPTSSSSTPKR